MLHALDDREPQARARRVKHAVKFVENS